MPGNTAPKRSYGCQNGDGNPYDFIVVTVSDMSTLGLCAPCFIQTANAMLEAMVDPDNPEVQRMLAEAGDVDQVPMDGDDVPGRGHNAPLTSTDPDAIEEFAGFILDDELHDDFQSE